MLDGTTMCGVSACLLALAAATVLLGANAAHAQAPVPGAAAADPPLKMLLMPWPDLDWSFPPPPGSKSPTRDPRDFAGTWRLTKAHLYVQPDVGAAAEGFAPYRPEAFELFKHRLKMNFDGTPVAEALVYCRPIGVVRGLTFPLPFEIMQEQDKIWQFFGEGGTRVIYLNQPHPKVLEHTYMGHSVGRWEGNTLVVDTVGFNDRTWLDMAGSPHGEKLHVVERHTKSADGSAVDIEVTIEDPDYYTRPFTLRLRNLWHPELDVPNFHCEDNPKAVVVKGITVYR